MFVCLFVCLFVFLSISRANPKCRSVRSSLSAPWYTVRIPARSSEVAEKPLKISINYILCTLLILSSRLVPNLLSFSSCRPLYRQQAVSYSLYTFSNHFGMLYCLWSPESPEVIGCCWSVYLYVFLAGDPSPPLDTRSPASAGIANRPLVFATRTYTLSGHNIEYLCLNLFTLRRFNNNESSGGRQIPFCPY